MQKDNKKISFGFNKLSKKINIISPTHIQKEENKVQLIQCVEDRSIKVVGGDSNIPKEPLVIPMKQPNKKLHNLVEIVKNNFKDNNDEEKKIEQAKLELPSEETEKTLSLDELATNELLNAVKNTDAEAKSSKIIEVPAAPEKVSFEGEKESTMDDYENIPISDFGLAMLRGMGWKDGEGIGKNQKITKTSQPVMRPKGMGLGADTIIKQSSVDKPGVDQDGKTLVCKKGACVKIIAGYHKGNCGQIIGLDDESGRFIIKTALNNLNISLNEFLVVPVTKEEYAKNSKVLNNAKYEEYMKNKQEEESSSTKIIKDDPEAETNKKPIIKKECEDLQSNTEHVSSSGDQKQIKTEFKSEVNNSEDSEKDNKRHTPEPREQRKNDSEKNERISREHEKTSHHRRQKSKNYSENSDSEEKKRNRSKTSSKDRRRQSKNVSKETSEEHKERNRKKHKKKKSRKNSSDKSSDDNYKRKSKRSSSKRYETESDSDGKHRKHKKDKSKEYKYKSSSSRDKYRDRSKADRYRRK